MGLFDKLFKSDAASDSANSAWNILETDGDLDRLIERSQEVPCVIFKHSTRCSISHMARHRLFSDWNIDADAAEPYYLDLIAHRDLSNRIAQQFDVQHESPQVILIMSGKAVYHTSHNGITVDGVKSALNAA
jgi:bacillithiol system protein YtxJ